MNTNLDYRLSPFPLRNAADDSEHEELRGYYAPELPTARQEMMPPTQQERTPLLGRDSEGKLKILNPNIGMKINPDSVWVDEYGDTAILRADDGGEMPLTRENWVNMLLRQPLVFPHPENLEIVNNYLRNQGFFHRDEILGGATDDYWTNANEYIGVIPPFYYSGNEPYAPPNLMPPSIDYRDDGTNDMRYYYLKNRNA